jgi:hypothetical protein
MIFLAISTPSHNTLCSEAQLYINKNNASQHQLLQNCKFKIVASSQCLFDKPLLKQCGLNQI